MVSFTKLTTGRFEKMRKEESAKSFYQKNSLIQGVPNKEQKQNLLSK